MIIAPAGRPAVRGGPPWAVMALAVVALMMMLTQTLLKPEWVDAWIGAWGFVPAEVSQRLQPPLEPGFWRAGSGLLTSLFVHSSWLHLVGNLAYLWVFGAGVERATGHARLVLAFLFFGALANLFVAVQVPGLDRPVIGASGGVSGIIGLYLGLFPARRIGLWLPLGLFLQFARIPALLVIGSWFTLQVVYTVFGPTTGAVAWWTHVAGFVAGLVFALGIRITVGGPAYSRED